MNEIFPDKSSQGKWEKLMQKITQLFQKESISPEIQVVLEMLKEDTSPGNQVHSLRAMYIFEKIQLLKGGNAAATQCLPSSYLFIF